MELSMKGDIKLLHSFWKKSEWPDGTLGVNPNAAQSETSQLGWLLWEEKAGVVGSHQKKAKPIFKKERCWGWKRRGWMYHTALDKRTHKKRAVEGLQRL
jgi:hypothetical protein